MFFVEEKLAKMLNKHLTFALIKSKHKAVKNTARYSSKLVGDLKAKFALVNRPNYYDKLIVKDKTLPHLKRASILIPISVQEILDEQTGKLTKKTFLTLTKRPDTMSTHSGEVCFVGGKRDQADPDDVFTAYREAKEEINLKQDQTVFLAQLCPLITFNQVLVTPVVVYFDKTRFRPLKNEREVELVFDLPTERFLSSKNHQIKCVRNESGEYYIHYFKDQLENDRKIITWGLTSFLSIVVSVIANSRLPEFHLPTPHKHFNASNMNDYLETYLFSKLAVSQTYFKKK